MVDKLLLEPLLKNQNWAYLWINSLELYTIWFFECQVENYWNILKLSYRILTFTSCKVFFFLFCFLKTGLELVFLPHFLRESWRKIFLLLYSITWPRFIVGLPLLLQILGRMCILIVCYPRCNVLNFKINPIFLIKSFFMHNEKVRTNINYLENKKSFQD